jgi:hypothetical protein
MNQMAEAGFVLFAGPLAGSEWGRVRVLMIAVASSDAEVRSRLEGDPWVASQRLVTSSVETWMPIVGADRLAPVK